MVAACVLSQVFGFRSFAHSVVMLALFAACASAGPHLVSATQSSVALVQDFGFAVGGMAHVNVSSYDRLTLAVGLCRSITEVASWNILRCFEVEDARAATAVDALIERRMHRCAGRPR